MLTKPPKDTNELAKYILDVMEGNVKKIEPPVKNAHAQALSQLGAAKGGAARKESLTPERRKEIAQKAAQSRWAKKGTTSD